MKYIVALILIAISSQVLAEQQYNMIIYVENLRDPNDPYTQQEKESAWSSFIEDHDGFTKDPGWMGIDLDGTDNSVSITSLPDEHYPESQLTGSIKINRNGDLKSVDSLSSVSHVEGRLNLYLNDLRSTKGLENLERVEGRFYLHHNSVTDINHLNKLSFVGNRLNLGHNSISDISGLSNLEYVGHDFSLFGNPFDSLSGLSSLERIDGGFNLGVTGLEDLSGLYNGLIVNGYMTIRTSNLKTLDGAENIQNVTGYFNIRDNPDLQDLRAIEHLDMITQLRVNDRPYDLRMAGESPLCQAIEQGFVDLVQDDDDKTPVAMDRVCEP